MDTCMDGTNNATKKRNIYLYIINIKQTFAANNFIYKSDGNFFFIYNLEIFLFEVILYCFHNLKFSI